MLFDAHETRGSPKKDSVTYLNKKNLTKKLKGGTFLRKVEEMYKVNCVSVLGCVHKSDVADMKDKENSVSMGYVIT